MAGPWEQYSSGRQPVTIDNATQAVVEGPWTQYQSPAPTAPRGTEPPKAPAAAPSPEGSTAGFVGGNLNKGIAGLLGLPMDTARNVANLGIAAHGFAMPANAPGGGGSAREPIAPGPGSSQWFEQLMRRGNMVSPAADPTSKGGEYAAAALQMAPGAMFGRPTNLPMATRSTGAAMTGGLTGQAAADLGGEEWRGIGTMAPGAAKMQQKTPGERATLERQGDAFGKAKDMGIPVPPRAMKADKPQQSIQDQINADLKQPPGTAIDRPTLTKYRNAHWQEYENLINAPQLQQGLLPTRQFRDSIRAIEQEATAAGGTFPQTFKSMEGVTKLLQDFQQGAPMQPKVVVRAVKKLRSDATTNMTSDKPEQIELGRAQRKIAGSLEDLIEANLTRTGADPALLGKYREARTAIAKSHDVESALDNTGKVSAQKLAQLQSEGRPLSGGLGDVAEVGRAFPSATKTPPDEAMFAKRMSPFGMTHPAAVGAHAAAKWHDPMTLTRPYQSMFVDPRNRLSPEQERAMRYIMGAMGANRGEIPAPPQ